MMRVELFFISLAVVVGVCPFFDRSSRGSLSPERCCAFGSFTFSSSDSSTILRVGPSGHVCAQAQPQAH